MNFDPYYWTTGMASLEKSRLKNSKLVSVKLTTNSKDIFSMMGKSFWLYCSINCTLSGLSLKKQLLKAKTVQITILVHRIHLPKFCPELSVAMVSHH